MPRKWTKEQKAELSRKMTGKKRPYTRPAMQALHKKPPAMTEPEILAIVASADTDENDKQPEIIIYEGAAYIPAKKRIKVI
jgi:hypothetical protein